MRAHSEPRLVSGDRVCTRLKATGDLGFDENWLQQLVHENPDILPVSELEPSFGELVSVCRELPTRHGPVDNLIMTPEGNLVLVEVKLWRNPEARRKVVAQALDYASCLFEMGYSDLEAAVLQTFAGSPAKPQSLFSLVAPGQMQDERTFIDAVSTNLRKGRALILVVGDGIRTETERLAGLLQSHAGAHFTFALVELTAYRVPDVGTLICPRTLARTEMIARGIVEIKDARIAMHAPETVRSFSQAARPETISAAQFYEAMEKLDADLPDKLRALLREAEPLGVYPEFKRSLILKWDPPEGKSINLGNIYLDGQLWTDAVHASVPEDLSRRYIEELAASLDTEVEKEALNGAWHLRRNGKAPKIQQVAGRLSGWVPVIAHLIEGLKARDS